MLVIWKKREFHLPSFALLFFLAGSDFLVGCVGQPSFVAYKLAESLGKFNAYCNLRMIEFFCGWITSSISFITLAAGLVPTEQMKKLHLRKIKQKKNYKYFLCYSPLTFYNMGISVLLNERQVHLIILEQKCCTINQISTAQVFQIPS